MNGTDRETAILREELSKLLTTLKHNREKIPLEVLKTKYRKGYTGLCADIKRRASDYAAEVALKGIRIHKDCLDEAVPIINGTIERSGLLKQLSRAAFSHQDIAEFDSLANTLREKILADLEPFYMAHLGCISRRNAWRIRMSRHSSIVWQTTASGRMGNGFRWSFTKPALHACRKEAHNRQNKIQKGERDKRTSDLTNHEMPHLQPQDIQEQLLYRAAQAEGQPNHPYARAEHMKEEGGLSDGII